MVTEKEKKLVNMANLYITEQNSVLRKTGDRLIVQKEDQILLDVQCHKIDAVLIFGNVQFTTQAVHELFEHGIELAILTRNGRLIGQITSPATKNITLRVEQFRKYEDKAFRLNISKTIVAGKIKNSLNFIRTFAYNHPEINLSQETGTLSAKIKSANSAERIDQLLGLEGTAAKAHFTAFGKMILADFQFQGRQKRPPPDPVNAMLSLSYTMVFNEISSLLDGLGFDPYLGYFHKIDYGRASLAADLMEEFRAPIADRLTLNLINNRIFATNDFRPAPRGTGIYFKRDPMKRYFTEYENLINHEFVSSQSNEKTTLRKCIRKQTEKLAATIQHDNAYEPYEMET